MMMYLLVIFSCLSLLSGCAIAPSLPDEQRVSVTEIIDLAKCELRDALIFADQEAPWFKGWVASAELTLKVATQSSASLGTPTFLIPITSGTFAAAFDAGIGEEAAGVAKIKFSTSVASTRDLLCGPPSARTRGPFGVSGTLGITAWLIRAIQAANTSGISKTTRSMGYTI